MRRGCRLAILTAVTAVAETADYAVAQGAASSRDGASLRDLESRELDLPAASSWMPASWADKASSFEEWLRSRMLAEAGDGPSCEAYLLGCYMCERDTTWMDKSWGLDMSPIIQQAWSNLGWDEFLWDAYHLAKTSTTTTRTTTTQNFLAVDDASTITTTTMTSTTTIELMLPESENLCWQSLTWVQQDATALLGYDIDTWHECKNSNCTYPKYVPRPPGHPSGQGDCLGVTDYIRARLRNETRPGDPWDSMPATTLNQLMALGWDRWSWSAQDRPQSYAKNWADLTTDERRAASFLGYVPQVWEGCTDPFHGAPCFVRLKRLEDYLRGLSWETMPSGVRRRLVDLGWELRSWVEGLEPVIYEVPWADLVPYQREAARLLGYTFDTWDDCPAEMCEDRNKFVQDTWRGFTWNDMKIAEQRAWLLLGHTEEGWNDGATIEEKLNSAAAMQLRWDEITRQQMDAAKFLRFDQGTWQGCNLNWTAVGSVANATPAPLSPIRTVRARMTIRRPFSEISGNVYGNELQSGSYALPTSFITVFEEAVARALFCDNEPLSNDPATYVDSATGEPACTRPDRYERQKHRIHVLNVEEGSILVEFVIVANANPLDRTAPMLLEDLQRQLDVDTSPIANDLYFGRFASAATVEEMSLSDLPDNELNSVLVFERMRYRYDETNACDLATDEKNGVIAPQLGCVAGGASRGALLQHGIMVLGSLAVILRLWQ